MRAAISGAITLLMLLVGSAGPASAQENALVVIIDPGTTRLDQAALIREIGASVERPTIRMTDELAQTASGRLSIAFSRPDRWVIRYESGGQVAWVSDRIRSTRELRQRIARLSRDVVVRVDGAVGTSSSGGTAPLAPTQVRAEHRGTWNDDVILALQNEIVDPFADDPPAPRRRAVTVLWSEVVDPFTDHAPRASSGEVWSEVLDPWSTEIRRR